MVSHDNMRMPTIILYVSQSTNSIVATAKSELTIVLLLVYPIYFINVSELKGGRSKWDRKPNRAGKWL